MTHALIRAFQSRFITGSFFDQKLVRESREKCRMFSIARSQPKGGVVYPEIPSLMPPWKLVSQYRVGKIHAKEYKHSYGIQVLGKTSVLDLLRMLQVVRHPATPILLLCWEREWVFCHRLLVADWLERAGIKVEVH